MPDKYQDEIEELLRGMGEKTPSRAKRDRVPPPDDAPIVPAQPPGSTMNQGRSMAWPSVSPGRLALVGLALLLIGSLWVRPFIWVGMAFLVGAYLFYFVKPRPAKRWRGQIMEEKSTPWEMLRRWMKK